MKNDFLPFPIKPLFEKPPGYPDNMDLTEFQKYIESLNIFDYGNTPPLPITGLLWESENVKKALKDYFQERS